MSKPVSRRQFILTTAASSLGLAATQLPLHLSAASPQAPTASPFIPHDTTELYTISHSLSETWAKALLNLQVSDKSRPQEYGGILCPTEHIVHGRVGDTIYPFLHMARRTGDHRYIDAAVLLFRWMENYVSQADGSWLNERKDSWKGTTVFSTIALCEALRYHGELLDPSFRSEIEARLLKAGNFIYDTVNIDYGNINYPLSASYALSLLGTLQDQPRFKEKGKLLSQKALSFFSRADNFIFGEGTPYYQPSPKGCFSVDLGYNVEETLPSLALYGLLNKDEELLQRLTLALRTHMEFMLPDGGWDNSWGTRNYKWTWWGSRTSDGCQPAYALLADRDPRFYRVALKNTQLLQRCTIDGLLCGGPHYASHHVPSSVHHTFCHIKALATILDHTAANPTPATTHGPAAAHVPSATHSPSAALDPSATHSPSATLDPSATSPKTAPSSNILLPREIPYGTRFFSDIQTWLVSTGDYRATVTGYDREYKAMHNGHATGGALTMLWHNLTGPLFVAGMNAYQLVEAGNMQADKDPLSMPLTPRIELTANGIVYMNISDLKATINAEEKNHQITITTLSRLVDKDQQDPPQGPIHCRTNYLFSPEKIHLSFSCHPEPTTTPNIRIILPLISPSGEQLTTINNNTFRLQKEKATVSLSADQPLQQLPTSGGRIFNFVPGLEAIPLAINHPSAELSITIKPNS